MIETLGQVLPEAARRYSTKTALIADGNRAAFADLEVDSNRLANALTELGLRPEDRVTLYAQNSREWVVSYYAVLKAGAVINPVNVMSTPAEVDFVMSDCGAKFLLGSAAKLAPFTARVDGGTLLVGLDGPSSGTVHGFRDLLARGTPEFNPVAVEPDALSTICYTSGTTGHPKGAMLSHRNVIMNAVLTSGMHGRTADDTVVTALPCPHVYGNVILNSAMLHGMTLVLLSRFDERAVLESIETYRATMFEGVPTMYFFLLNHPGLDRHRLDTLRICTVGGQTMPVAKMEEVVRRFGCPLVELWGMTELAGLATTFSHDGPVRHGSIGVPMPGMEAKIVALDDPAKTLDANEAGELVVRGPLVMLGYYRNETATRNAIDADGWLRTGDVARRDADGYLYVVDRCKDMILTAGFNVYPAELERVIAAHEDVAMVAVGPVPDEEKGEIAKAYIVPKAGCSPSAEKIIAFCRERLASYKVPREIQFVTELPRTSTGKIMRRNLRQLDQLR